MISQTTIEFIARLPFARIDKAEVPEAKDDPVAHENARKCEARFGVPKDLYMELTNLCRQSLRERTMIGAFLAGVAVGWLEHANTTIHKD